VENFLSVCALFFTLEAPDLLTPDIFCALASELAPFWLPFECDCFVPVALLDEVTDVGAVLVFLPTSDTVSSLLFFTGLLVFFIFNGFKV
jgi:hypothetical protein